MKNFYAVWAVVLAVLLELGIFYLYYFAFIGTATMLSSAFAVAAFTVAALMLRDTGFRHREGLSNQDSRE
jgi:hypothetical protein